MSKTSNYLFPRLSGNKLSPIKSTSQPIKVAEQPYKQNQQGQPGRRSRLKF